MKKTLLALAIPAALVAGSASAATVYENDTTKFSVGGAVEIQYRQTAAEEIASTDGEIRVDDGDLAFDVEYKVSDALTALAGMHMNVGEDKETTGGTGFNDKGSVTEDEIFVGFKGDFGQVTVGTKTPFIDGSGVGTDIELKDNGGTTLGSTDPYDQLVEYTYSANGLTLGTGYVFAQDDDSTNSSNTGKTAEMTEIKVGYDFGTVSATAYYTVQNGLTSATATSANDDQFDSFQLDVMANLDQFYVGAGISSSELDSKSDRLMSYELAGSYAATEKVTVGLGFAVNDADAKNSSAADSQSSIYGNVQYKLAKNTRAYAEVSFEDTGAATGDTTGTGVAVGMEVKF